MDGWMGEKGWMRHDWIDGWNVAQMLSEETDNYSHVILSDK
jgi:hypothetical protein